jgi:hypothetical protein
MEPQHALRSDQTLRRLSAVVRRLRLGVGGSLYKQPGESTYTVDLSKLR